MNMLKKWYEKLRQIFCAWRNNHLAVKWTIAIVTFLFLFLSSPFISRHQNRTGLKIGDISSEDVVSSKYILCSDNNGDTIVLKKGQVIIRKGEEITSDKMKRIEIYYKNGERQSFSVFWGMGLLSLAFMLIVSFYLFVFRKHIFKNNQFLFLISVVVIITLGLAKLISSSLTLSNYFIPVAFASIMLAILLDSSTAVLITAILSIMSGIMCRFDLNVSLVALCGGLVSIYAENEVKKRMDLTRVGLYAGAMNFLVILSLGIFERLSFHTIFINCLWGLGNGLIFSVFLVMGMLHYFENFFGITTDFKLMELSDLNHGLLKQLFLKASGTYQHSLIVSELAENAAQGIGAKPLLAKVGGYYHDVGKIANPIYFIENQLLGMNVHDEIMPEISNSILNAHIKDGVEIAKKNHLPPEVIDIIEQHHGMSQKMYFITNGNMGNNFRYPGPKPQTKEAAIVMLADSVEAATRASSSKDFAAIEKKVETIIGNYLADQQFEECPITLRDLNTISKSFISVLSGIFHFRIEYPER